MWLWKKFCNTDIVGKIYILIILFIVVVATITVVTRYKNNNTNQIVNEQNDEIIDESLEILVSDVFDSNNEIIEISLEENTEIETATIQSEKEVAKTNLDTEKQENSINNNNTTTATTTTSNEIENKTTQTEEKEDIQEIANLENTTEELIEESTTTVPIEEYKVNNEMINIMKEYILNNPSEYMQNYGFEVVVDSSIIELTNQFTYTEQRMRDKLTLKFGTIKIYALDYYYNGNLVMTECFML